MTYMRKIMDGRVLDAKQSLRRVLTGLFAVFVALFVLCGAPMSATADDAASSDGTVVVSVTGVDDPDASKVLGVTWVESHEVEFSAGMTAWDVLKPALDEAGCTYDAQDSDYGVFIQSITSADGLLLEGTNEEPYSFWSFIVNGEPAAVGVSSYELQDGDTVELVYYARGEAPVVEAVPADGDAAQEAATPMPINVDEAQSASSNTGLVIGLVVAGVVVAGIVVFVVKKSKGASK